MKLLVFFILLDSVQSGPVAYAHGLYQRREVLEVKVAVGAAVGLAWAGRVLGQDLLAAEWAVAAATAVRVASDVAVDVAHVVAVFLVESVVGDVAEALAPEDQALLEVQADALEEQSVLQAAVVFEVGIAAERAVQVGHAGREVLGEVVDVAGGDLGADGGSRVGAVGAVGGDEVLGEVVEDRGEAVVLVETGERAGRELLALVFVSLLM